MLKRTSKKNNFKKWIVFITLIYLSFCTTHRKAAFTPQQLAEYNSQINKADLLLKKGCYPCLQEAYQIYQAQLEFPSFQDETRTKLLKVNLLLAFRENELFIPGRNHLSKAKDLIQNFPYLSGFSLYSEFAQTASTSVKGHEKDDESSSGIVDYYRWMRENVKPLNAKLKEKAENEEFFAYLYLSLNSVFSYFIEEKDDFSRFWDIYPDSSLIHFKLALFPKPDEEKLEAVLKKESRFHEAYYFLGEIAFKLRNIITAEKNFLKAYEKIPTSISTILSLTKIYFTFEEFEKCQISS